MFKEIQACRICGNSNLQPLIDLGTLFLTGQFPRDAEALVARGPLELVRCWQEDRHQFCGLVQLRHTYDLDQMYGLNYGYRSGLNRSMVDHLAMKVDYLKKQVGLAPDDVVLDIGSNDGTLLSMFRDSTLRLIGMDPSAGKFREYYPPEVLIVPDFFSEKAFLSASENRRAKLITSIAMFYDLERPLDFMREVQRILHPEGIWHMEMSYLPLMLQRSAYDTICHEHLEYYGLRQISWMAERSDLEIRSFSLNDINGGSIAVTLGHRSAGPAGLLLQEALYGERDLDDPQTYQRFACRINESKNRLLGTLEQFAGEGKRVFGYGASTKGNVTLQYCGLSAENLPYIAEVNEDKFGCFTPGSKIPIISEDEAKALRPDYFLVLPWHFELAILSREAAFLGGGGGFIFPLPDVRVISR